VLSAGTQTDLAALGPIPESCTVRASVDQMAVLDCADVFLTHCGMNSASEGLWHGLPLVLYPQTPEQHGVANRVAALGAGVPLTDPSADGIRRAVEAALTDPAFLPRKRAEARRQLPPLRRRGRGSRCHRARGELSDSMQKHAPADSGSVFLCYVNSYSFFSR